MADSRRHAINELIQANYCSVAEFARQIKVCKSTLSRVLNGKYPGDDKNVIRSCIEQLKKDGHSFEQAKSTATIAFNEPLAIKSKKIGLLTFAYCESEQILHAKDVIGIR